MSLENTKDASNNSTRVQHQNQKSGLLWRLTFFGLALLLIFQMYFWVLRGLAHNREQVSADDHYSWLIKAPQMQLCPKGDCVFNQSIRSQVDTKPDFSFELNNIRWREAHCLLDVYTPLYTFLLIWTHNAVGGTWEYAYHVVSLIGESVVGIGLITFALAFFGWQAGAVLLLFLNLSPFALQSWFAPSPSIFTAGLFFGFMAIVAALKKRASLLLPVFFFVLLFMHPVGKIFSLLMILYFLKDNNLWIKIKKIPSGAYFALGIFVANSALSFFVTEPRFKLIPWYFDSHQEYFEYLEKAIDASFRISTAAFEPPFSVTLWHYPATGLFLIFASLALGSRYLSRARFAFGVAFVVVLFASVFHKMRGYPGELNSRIVRYVQVFTVGSLALSWQQTRAILPSRTACTNWMTRKSWSAWLLFFVFLGALLSRVTRAPFYSPIAEQQVIAANDSFYSDLQVKKIFNANNECGAIVYTHQMPMWYYTLHGALKCEAIATYLWPTPSHDVDKMMAQKHPELVAMQNPIYDKMGLPKIKLGRPLTIRNEQKQNLKLTLMLRTPLVETQAELITFDALSKTTNKQSLHFNTQNINPKMQIDLQGEQTLQLKVVSGALLLEGFIDDPEVRWPWGKPVSISFAEDINLPTTPWLSFAKLPDISYYFPNGGKVLDDRGGSVLLKVNPYVTSTP